MEESGNASLIGLSRRLLAILATALPAGLFIALKRLHGPRNLGSAHVDPDLTAFSAVCPEDKPCPRPTSFRRTI